MKSLTTLDILSLAETIVYFAWTWAFRAFVNNFINYKGSNIWINRIKINFSKIDPKLKQTNVGYSVMD